MNNRIGKQKNVITRSSDERHFIQVIFVGVGTLLSIFNRSIAVPCFEVFFSLCTRISLVFQCTAYGQPSYAGRFQFCHRGVNYIINSVNLWNVRYRCIYVSVK